MSLRDIIKNLPEVRPPTEKRLSFNVKLKWTLIILVAFFILANVPLYALTQNALQKFEYLAIILGTDFGSIISLGIGPIVMASIILQLLVGSKIIDIDTTTDEGKRFFQGVQKLMILFFIVFEACIYVLMKGLQAEPGYAGIVIFQLILGGLAIMFMDEVTSKWGFGSGVSLFILAGVGWRMFSGLFQFLRKNPAGGITIEAVGRIPVIIDALIKGDTTGFIKALAVVIATILIFLIVVWAQSLKVEVPLSYDRLRGYGIKWPLSFFYTSVIPVILTAALAANIQLFASLLENWLGHPTFLGTFSEGGVPIAGFVYWIARVNLLEAIITKSFKAVFLLQALGHIVFYVFFATLFAFFWMKTSGMDSETQAKNILSSGLQIPGFRKDQRVLETVLSRYILPLTIMGGAAIGLLASSANLLGTITSGTAILLAVMITFQFYQNIVQQHQMDMHPALKKMIGG